MKKNISFVDGLMPIFVRHGIFSKGEVKDLKRGFKEASQEAFDEFLLDEGLIEKDDLLKALGDYYRLPALDLAGYFFQTLLLRKFPKGVMIRNAFIPLEVDQNVLIVAAGNPNDPELIDKIGDYVSYSIQLLAALKVDIVDSVQEYYDKSDMEFYESQDAYEDFGVKNLYDIDIEGDYASPGEEEDL